MLPAAGHLSALVPSSGRVCHPMLLQLYCSSSSCCRALAAVIGSTCTSFRSKSRSNARHSACSSSSKDSWSEPRRHASRGVGHQQAASDAVSTNALLSSLQQREEHMLTTSAARKQLQHIFLQVGMPHQQGGALSTISSSTHALLKRGGMLYQAAAAAAVAGPGTAVLHRLLQPQQLGVRGLSSRTADRWRPVGRQPRVLLGQLCAQAHSMQELQQLLQQHAEHVNGIAVAAAYHRAGKLCQGDPALVQSAAAGELLQHLDQLLPSVRGQLQARQLANVIWSCAYTKHRAPIAQLLPDFMQPETLSTANSQAVGNVLWALATLMQQVPQQQLQQLVGALVLQRDIAVPQHISQSVWALGKLGYQVVQQQQQEQLGALLAAFTAEGMLVRAKPQEIANLLLGMAYMGQQLPNAQLRLLEAKLVSKRSRATTQGLANFLWAVSDLGQHVQPQQLEKLLAAFDAQLHRAVPQGISITLLACAQFRHLPVQLLRALQEQQHMQRFLVGAESQHLANTAWACGMLGHNSELLLGGLLQLAMELLQQGSSRFVCQELCNLCWAVAVLDLRQYVPAVLQLVQAASRVWGSAAPEGLRQLYQVHLWLLDHGLAPAEGGKGPGLLQVLSQQQLGECRRAWQDQVARDAAATPSLLQQQVFAALQQLPGWQVPPQQEVLTADKNFSIDIASVTAAGVRLAVEVDGPSHFISSGNRVNGPTQYRIRALTARGYTVVSIPYWQWDDLRGSAQQQDYLKGRLQGLTLSAEPVAADAAAAASAGQPPSTAAQGSRRRDRSTKRRMDSSH